MCFLRGTSKRYEPKSFANAQHMGVHGEHVMTTDKGEGDGSRFDANSLVLAEVLSGILGLHLADEFEIQLAAFCLQPGQKILNGAAFLRVQTSNLNRLADSLDIGIGYIFPRGEPVSKSRVPLVPVDIVGVLGENGAHQAVQNVVFGLPLIPAEHLFQCVSDEFYLLLEIQRYLRTEW